MRKPDPGMRVKYRRLRKNWTKLDLCRISGIHCSTITQLEKRQNLTTIENLYRLACALGCSLEYLVRPLDGHDIRRLHEEEKKENVVGGRSFFEISRADKIRKKSRGKVRDFKLLGPRSYDNFEWEDGRLSSLSKKNKESKKKSAAEYHES